MIDKNLKILRFVKAKERIDWLRIEPLKKNFNHNCNGIPGW